jgi:hypothetical protein
MVAVKGSSKGLGVVNMVIIAMVHARYGNLSMLLALNLSFTQKKVALSHPKIFLSINVNRILARHDVGFTGLHQ